MESTPLEANKIIKEFEKRAKEAEENAKKGVVPSKTTRLIEKFEKKAQGDDKAGPNGSGAMISNIKKVFEPGELEDGTEKPSNLIPVGSTNKLIERFQEPVPPEQPTEE